MFYFNMESHISLWILAVLTSASFVSGNSLNYVDCCTDACDVIEQRIVLPHTINSVTQIVEHLNYVGNVHVKVREYIANASMNTILNCVSPVQDTGMMLSSCAYENIPPLTMKEYKTGFRVPGGRLQNCTRVKMTFMLVKEDGTVVSCQYFYSDV